MDGTSIDSYENFHHIFYPPNILLMAAIPRTRDALNGQLDRGNNAPTLGKHVRSLADVGAVGSTAVQLLLPPSPHPPLPRQTHFHASRPLRSFLMLPPPHSHESQAEAEAVTVGPSAGNFLWTAGNNSTWGLDSAEFS